MQMDNTSELRDLASGLALLSDTTRLGILKTLGGGPKNVGAICDAVGLKQPAVSHHLGLLRLGRLVSGTRKGKSVFYVIEGGTLKGLSSGLGKLTPRK